LTSSLSSAGNVSPTVSFGVQTPKYSFAPPSVSNAAAEVVDLMIQIGMPLDPWQITACELMLGEQPNGKWSAFEFGLIVARQNGKGAVLEARELGGLFLFGERRIIHSAHVFSTAAEAFQRIKTLIDGTDWLRKRIKKCIESPGNQHFELLSGQIISYKTRTPGGARGLSAETVILDEAQHLSARQIAGLMPVAAAQINPQLIYTGTVLAEAVVFRGVVERGRKQIGTRLGYAEWGADADASSNDPQAWAEANPALGYRITPEYVQAEHDSLVAARAEAEFRMERLSIWPEVSEIGSVIGIQEWEMGNKQFAIPDGVPISVGVAISPARDWASVGIAFQIDGISYVDLAKHETGTDWLLPYLVNLTERRKPECIVVDQVGPAGTLLVAMGAAQLPVRVTDTAAFKTACATFVDSVKQGTIRHRGDHELTAAAVGVRERKVGDSWVFSRRDSASLIDPLEAVTLAVWGLNPDPKKKEFFVQNLNDF
jgi:phage terminase large subunit-like protein